MSPTPVRSSPARATRFAGWLPSWHYPAVIGFAFATFAGLGAAGASLVVQTYTPVVLTALVVAMMEWRQPYRADWQPAARDVSLDLSFLAFVQLLLPPLVGFLFTYALIEPARALHLPIAGHLAARLADLDTGRC